MRFAYIRNTVFLPSVMRYFRQTLNSVSNIKVQDQQSAICATFRSGSVIGCEKNVGCVM